MHFRKKDYIFMALLPLELYLVMTVFADNYLFYAAITVIGTWVAFYTTEAIVHLYSVMAARAESEGNMNIVKKYYRQIFLLSPLSLSGIFACAVLHTLEGRWEYAEEMYREFLRRRPWDIRAGYNLGIVLSRMGKFQEAKKWFKAIIHFYPQLNYAHTALGDIYFSEGKVEKAESHYLTAYHLGDRSAYLKLVCPETCSGE